MKTPPDARSGSIAAYRAKLERMYTYAKKLEQADFDPKEAGLLEVDKRPNPPKPVRTRRMSSQSGSCTLNEHLTRKRLERESLEQNNANKARKKLAHLMKQQVASEQQKALLDSFLHPSRMCM